MPEYLATYLSPSRANTDEVHVTSGTLARAVAILALSDFTWELVSIREETADLS